MGGETSRWGHSSSSVYALQGAVDAVLVELTTAVAVQQAAPASLVVVGVAVLRPGTGHTGGSITPTAVRGSTVKTELGFRDGESSQSSPT